ncbi:hypothetical protein CVT24_002374 [Panaeolus cyanescens]|uniref:CNH domain-containing protein n=1 Tax=Panaeolus cyanescens TaxID=181874 RepID=A0A409WJU6_9AGAR|nr:hypothetical protein CVT24_002374 [Panaeolus cyanescens]
MFVMKDRLFYTKEIPLPSGALLAKRVGKSMCIADKQHYSIVDLENASLFPVLPLSQAYDEVPFVVKPSITVISPNEFLIVSWTGASSLGLFITSEGDPVRGTLEWPSHPESLNLDYPHITSLLPNGTIEIHNVETQSIVQVIGAPVSSPSPSKSTSPTKPSSGHTRSTSSGSASKSIEPPPAKRLGIISSVGGYLVPSVQNSDKMKRVPFKLIRTPLA